MQRGAGVLMHIASLPGPFGIGVFGEEAIDFAKQLKKQGMKYWQVLPVRRLTLLLYLSVLKAN